MKQIYENIVVIVLLFLSIFVHATMIIANLQITSARNFHANAIEEIQASGLSEEIINQEISLASESGWELKCDKYVNDSYSDVRVELDYTLVGLPLIGDQTTKTIVGYAR